MDALAHSCRVDSVPACRHLLWIAAILIVSGLMGVSSAHAAGLDVPAVELRPGESARSLRDFVRYTPVDTSLSTAQLMSSLDQASLLPIAERTIDFGPPTTPLMVLVKVRNASDEAGTWTFSTDRGSLRHIEMFEVIGQQMSSRLANADVAAQQKMLKDFHAFAFEFSLAAGEERVLGVVFEAETSTKLPMTIMQPQAYQSLIRTQFNIVLAATVATLTLILLNAILFGVTGRSAFFHFVMAELALVFQALHLSGYTTIFFFSEHAELARALSGAAKVAFALFSLRFLRTFLRTRETWPRFERPARIYETVCWIALICLALYPFVPFLTLRFVSDVTVLIVVVALIGLPWIAAVAVKRYGWIYSPLLLGWSVWSIYLIYTILAVYTPLPEFPYQWRWMAPIGFFEALMLSIALGLDIRNMQQREIHAQKKLSEALKNRLELVDATAVAKSNRAIAEQQLRETSNLIRSGGHDSRNFTGALKMYGHVIQNSTDLDNTRNYGALVAELAEQLDATFDFIVDGTASDIAVLDSLIRIENIDTNALLETVKQIYAQAAQQEGMSIRCRSTVDNITGDRHVLIRLLGNLVSNAIKYGRGGTILLTARRMGDATRLEVWDQGPGIKPEQLQRLLSPARVRERLNPEVEGTGSGLGICLELCKKIGVTLTARSVIDRGSVFQLELYDGLPAPVKGNQAIGVLDDPAHWPENVINPLRSRGIRVQFVREFVEAAAAETPIILVDPALHSSPPEPLPESRIAICSYESSTQNLGKWAMVSSVVLTKPVTAEGVMYLVGLLRSGDQ